MSVIIGCQMYDCRNNGRSKHRKNSDVCHVNGCVVLKKTVIDGVDYLSCDEYKPKEIEDVLKWG